MRRWRGRIRDASRGQPLGWKIRVWLTVLCIAVLPGLTVIVLLVWGLLSQTGWHELAHIRGYAVWLGHGNVVLVRGNAIVHSVPFGALAIPFAIPPFTLFAVIWFQEWERKRLARKQREREQDIEGRHG